MDIVGEPVRSPNTSDSPALCCILTLTLINAYRPSNSIERNNASTLRKGNIALPGRFRYLSSYCKVTTMDYNEHNVDSPSLLLWILMTLMSASFYISHCFDHTLFRSVTLPYLIILFFFVLICLAYVLAKKELAIPRILSFVILAGITSIPSGISRLVDLLPNHFRVDPVTPPLPPSVFSIEVTDEDEKEQLDPEQGTLETNSESRNSGESPRDGPFA